MSQKSKLLRFHRSIFFPDWAEKSMEVYLEKILARGNIVFSVHSVEKVVQYSFEYGKQLFKFLLKSLKREGLEASLVFEFYAVDEEIRKACLRFSFDGFPVDLILVISTDGTIITVFTSNKEDNHSTLNVKLYERK